MFCGGKGLVNIFEAQRPVAGVTTTATTTAISVKPMSSVKTGGARRNAPIF